MIQSLAFWQVLLVSVVGYWSLPVRFRDIFLLTVSLGYLATLDWRSVVALSVLATVFWRLTPLLAGDGPAARRCVVGSVLACCGFLGAVKYLPPLLQALSAGSGHAVWIIPLGVSYYIFKLIHYVVESSRGTIALMPWPSFFLYLFLFPTFTAGPIERYDHFIANREQSPNRAMFAEGGTRIIFGLIKIGVISDAIQRLIFKDVPDVNYLTAHINELPTFTVWGVVLRTYLTTYIGFSAYSDIAIGSSRLFGISILENFKFPLFARNMSDFWQRWHMTLSRWCQSYVYMPVLASSRQPYVAVVASFIVMGIWHSLTATRVAWGLWHAAGTIAYMMWRRRKRQGPASASYLYTGIAILLTQLYVLGSWAILAGEDNVGLIGGLRVLAKMVFLTLP